MDGGSHVNKDSEGLFPLPFLKAASIEPVSVYLSVVRGCPACFMPIPYIPGGSENFRLAYFFPLLALCVRAMGGERRPWNL